MAEWFDTYRSVVFPWHCDHYGHMNARWYVHHFDDGGFHLWTMAGCGHAEMRSKGVETVVGRYTINYLHEMRSGELIVVRSGFTKLGNKSCTHFHRMLNADTEVLCATLECVEVFFDPQARSSRSMPDWVRQRLEPTLVGVEG
jgi:acyl-CoA thioester hydrolase